MKQDTHLQGFKDNNKEQAIRDHLIICLALAAKRGWFSLDEFSYFLSPDVIRPTYLLQVADVLVKQGWIMPDEAKGIGYYSLTKRCTEAHLEDQIASDLHLKMAEYFTTSDEKVPPAKIAYHWEMAGDVQKEYQAPSA